MSLLFENQRLETNRGITFLSQSSYFLVPLLSLQKDSFTLSGLCVQTAITKDTFTDTADHTLPMSHLLGLPL